MKKGAVIVLAVVLALAAMVPAALALTDNQKAELQSMYEQQHQLRLQILEKQVEAGLVEAEDAEAWRERMAEQWELRKQHMAAGDYNYGFGRRGNRGGCGSMGRGFGGGGCGNCPVAEEAPAL